MFSIKSGKAVAKKPKKKQDPEGKPLPLAEVSAVLAGRSRAGHTAEVRALLIQHGDSC